MSGITIHVLKPSVNNLGVRVFVRAAGLECTEEDAWGKTGTPEFLAINPSKLTPTIEDASLPRGAMWESCAIMAYLCNKHGLTSFYPTDPAERATIDGAMFYTIGTVYPMIARACYPALGFPGYPGETSSSDADDAVKAASQQAAVAALAGPLEVVDTFFLAGRRFIGGDSVSIADIRLAASLEFLRAIDYPMPAWAERYLAAIESELGAAYSEPAGDVRGYIAYIRAQQQ